MDLYNFIFNEDYLIDDWLMRYEERATLFYLLSKIKPVISIEIGTYRGGSLRPISYFSDKVYSFDIRHDHLINEHFYKNVEFISGDSKLTVPNLIKKLNQDSQALEFVIIDGDHTEEGVRTDINNILAYIPKKPLYIIMHDSFNPIVRKGIITANWTESPYVHYVEVDFVNGIFTQTEDLYRQMWGGFALAVLLPTERKNDLTITMENELAYQSTLPISVHKNRDSL